MILGIHLFFDWASAPDDATWYESVFFFLVEASGWLNGLGFAFVMLFFTWINRVSTIRPWSLGDFHSIIVSITPWSSTLTPCYPTALGLEPSKNSFR